MPKIKLTDYVKTLHSLLDEANEKSVSDVFAGFLRLLQKNHQLQSIDEILCLYQESLDQKNDTLTATVYYQDTPPDSAQQTLLCDFLQKRYHVTSAKLHLQAKNIGPGLIVDVAGERFNWSLEKQLQAFTRQLTSG